MIKNIVFDIGNVLVKWEPIPVMKKIFPERLDHEQMVKDVVKSEIWYNLNKGKISEQEAIVQYHQLLDLKLPQVEILMQEIKESLVPMQGSFELVEQLSKANYPLYIITDNTFEIEAYLRSRYNFWQHFKGVVNSARIGVLKPNPAIYHHLLDTYKLTPEECIFFDDLPANVEGAIKVNMQARLFTSAKKCIEDLQALNISVRV